MPRSPGGCTRSCIPMLISSSVVALRGSGSCASKIMAILREGKVRDKGVERQELLRKERGGQDDELANIQLLLLPAHVDLLWLQCEMRSCRMERGSGGCCCSLNGGERHCRRLRGDEEGTLDAEDDRCTCEERWAHGVKRGAKGAEQTRRHESLTWLLWLV